MSRLVLTIAGKLLIVQIYGPAAVIAVNRSNGGLVWLTRLDSNPLAVITASGTSYSGLMAFYVGVSSLEETLPAEQCCTFRGSLVKLNILYGLYTALPEAEECQERQNNQTTPPTEPDQCIGPNVNFNSIIAFEMESGRISLVPNSLGCLTGPNLDADFREAPMLITISTNGTERDIAVAVQKSGFAWVVDRDSGDILAGPGSIEGGGTWGTTTDGKRSTLKENFTLAPSTRMTTAGAWVALDVRSREILWSTANPSNETAPTLVSVASGVVFAGSVALEGPCMQWTPRRAMWSYNSGATVYGGISISYGCIYHGNGYKLGAVAQLHPTWIGGTDLYALCVK
ncbi:hypothetical protein EUGRSUZ_G02524 [Eucalyptus grandis]|uniref:Uncharacterized protein n=2 Tax=Eucalyptus grandis TaxID=71139 RepID=A0A059BFK5_EUCGR|nr:hypothetical protein EUGRSUZ_G02524 [Eucalyptus grandis]